jgi:acetolactate synthase regulatory subunit
MAPSVSYSITVRLEVASRGRAVSEITRVVEQAGGVVTALDVTAGRAGRLQVDVTCAARDTEHADAIVSALSAIPDVTVHKVSDRAAAQALADVVSPDEIGPHYIIPSVFHPDVASSVAVAVRDAATQDPGR